MCQIALSKKTWKVKKIKKNYSSDSSESSEKNHAASLKKIPHTGDKASLDRCG
jgi:hypothetical protein